MNTVFFVISTVLWMLLMLIWKSNDRFNLFCKAILLGMSVWSGIMLIIQLGWIYKGPGA